MAEPIPSEVPSSNDAWAKLFEHNERLVNEIGTSTGVWQSPDFTSPEYRQFIDHTLLKKDAAAEEIDRLCEEAWEWGFASVCVRPEWVKHCVDNLASCPQDSSLSKIDVASVIGFHEGDFPLEHKLQETNLSLKSGATELDVVLNASLLKSRCYTAVYHELSSIRSATASFTAASAPQGQHVTLKLILETSRLNRSEIVAACTLAGLSDWDFVKTSTGFHGEGATQENVALMRQCSEVVVRTNAEKGSKPLGQRLNVKASGGIRMLADATKMVEAGAGRLGCSASVKIMEQAGAVKQRELHGGTTSHGDVSAAANKAS